MLFITGLLAGAMAGWANQKLLPIAAAVVLWELVRRIGEKTGPEDSSGQTPASSATGRWLRRLFAFSIPIGFVVGTLTFWLYGLWVDAEIFYIEHIQHHLVGRVTHDDALGYGGYPSIPGLWLELWQHTGFLLLPLGIAALGVLCTRKAARPSGDVAASGWRDTPGLWAVWFVLTAVAFSLIDWRQTKHLMPLLLPLLLAPVRWTLSWPNKGGWWLSAAKPQACANSGAPLRSAPATPTRVLTQALVPVLLAGLLVWNLGTLWNLLDDFRAFTITPDW